MPIGATDTLKTAKLYKNSHTHRQPQGSLQMLRKDCKHFTISEHCTETYVSPTKPSKKGRKQYSMNILITTGTKIDLSQKAQTRQPQNVYQFVHLLAHLQHGAGEKMMRETKIAGYWVRSAIQRSDLFE